MALRTGGGLFEGGYDRVWFDESGRYGERGEFGEAPEIVSAFAGELGASMPATFGDSDQSAALRGLRALYVLSCRTPWGHPCPTHQAPNIDALAAQPWC